MRHSTFHRHTISCIIGRFWRHLKEKSTGNTWQYCELLVFTCIYILSTGVAYKCKIWSRSKPTWVGSIARKRRSTCGISLHVKHCLTSKRLTSTFQSDSLQIDEQYAVSASCCQSARQCLHPHIIGPIIHVGGIGLHIYLWFTGFFDPDDSQNLEPCTS